MKFYGIDGDVVHFLCELIYGKKEYFLARTIQSCHTKDGILMFQSFHHLPFMPFA